MAKKKKAAVDKTAQMFEATSIVPNEVFAEQKEAEGKTIEKIAEEIVQDRETEKVHDELKKDEESVGIETVVESTKNEVTLDLQKKLEELQDKYIQVITERDELKKQLDSFVDLSEKLEKIEEDASTKNKQLETYEFNEGNYRTEILNLKAALKDYQDKMNDLTNANAALSKENLELKKLLPQKQTQQPVPSRFSMKNAMTNNGYSSWN